MTHHDHLGRGRRSILPLVLVSSVAVLCSEKLSAQQLELTDPQKVIHVLNRLGYGPRPGDIEKVKAMGIEAYIEMQLHPERIADPVTDSKLAWFPTLKMGFGELVEAYKPEALIAERRNRTVLDKAAMAELRKRERDRSTGRRRRAALNPRVSGMDELGLSSDDFEVRDARIVRAVHSERQLLELLVDFWFNHFNVTQEEVHLIPDYEGQVIRPRALGKFENLLVATAQHPAMLLYLDNWLSSAPADVVQKRLESGHAAIVGEETGALAQRRRKPFFDNSQGLNENYGRELMELHTLGVDGGYTQEDVVQVAKAFTGWTLSGVASQRQTGTFVFDPLIHEEGNKVVLGQTIEGRRGIEGIEEGLEILHMLANHPSTARFISTKLVRRFVADDPPQELVEAAARTFLETEGDIREVLRTIFASPEFFSPRYYQTKIKKPIEFVASSLRAVDAEFIAKPGNNLNRAMASMGEALYLRETPDGFPDVGSAWISTNSLMQRIHFGLQLATVDPPNMTVDLDSSAELFEELGFPRPSAAQITRTRFFLTESAGLGSGMAQMQEMMGPGGGATTGRGPAETRQIAIALMLGSPQFQKR